MSMSRFFLLAVHGVHGATCRADVSFRARCARELSGTIAPPSISWIATNWPVAGCPCPTLKQTADLVL